MKRAVTLLIAFILIAPGFAGCSAEPVSRTEFLFDTVVTITAYGAKNSDLEAAIELCRRYDGLLSKTAEGSDVWRVNHAGGQPIEVSDELREIIEISEKYYELSGGLFDITCGAETALWDFTAEDPALPTQEQLDEAVSRTGFGNLHTEGNLVWIDNGGQLDFGAVAKGYIADKTAGLLRRRGVTGAVIDLGGDILTVGRKNNGEPWVIAISDPGGDGYARLVEVGEKAVVTSGLYERFFEIDGVRYHHILDPRTGMPADTDLMSVTIISDSAAEGDALATVCVLLGSERAAALLDTMPEVESYFIMR
ncbi:MAG: FAD:protein FMN transferase [Oscillospiraceae bacterium]|nr:FAD:protein FMN transferase [Oscillospiraceae bacterium]